MPTVKELQEQLRVIDSEISSLAKQHDDLVSSIGANQSKLKRRIDEFNAWGDRLRAEAKAFDERSAALNKDISDYDSDVKEFQADVGVFNSDIDALTALRNRHNADVDALNEKIRFYNEIRNDDNYSQAYKDDLRREIESERSRLTAQSALIDSENQRLNAVGERLRSRNRSLKSRRTSLEERDGERSRDRAVLEGQIDDYKKESSAIDAATEALRIDIERLDAFKQQINDKLARRQKILKALEAAKEKKYILKDNSIKLSTEVVGVVTEISQLYFDKTGKKIVITSGTRTAQTQASALYTKLVRGDDVVRLYRNKEAIKEIKKAYDDNASKPKSEVIEAMRAVIQAQIDRGVYISKHLRKGAFDVRSRDMTDSDKAAFREAVASDSNLVLLEEGTPPHFHVHFKVIPALESVERVGSFDFFRESRSDEVADMLAVDAKNEMSRMVSKL